jgi:PhnB protein
MPVNYLPRDYHNVTPYLVVDGAAKLIDFLKRVFGATEKEMMKTPDGRVMHAEVRIGDSVIMMGEPGGQWKATPAALYVYVEDTDSAYKRALEMGATSRMEPADQFYGDRNAGVQDSWGNLWWIATHKEDVAPDELEKRARAARPH